jgi:hypothetical protein
VVAWWATWPARLVGSSRGEGRQVTTFTRAITEASREGRPYTLYVPCTSLGKSAEACSLLNAEDLVAIQSKLTWRSHKAKCGQEHSQLCVRVQELNVVQGAEVPA